MQARKLAIGPRLDICGKALCQTGGHTWWACREADGVDGVRQAVREQIKGGADWIKLMASERHTQYTVAELRTAVEEAHAVGVKVTAHATIPKAIDNVLDAGLDCIEHGGPFSDEQIERMLKTGTFVVPYPVARLQPGRTRARVRHDAGTGDACGASGSRIP